MSKILVSGLVNLETTCSVQSFPIKYNPIDYNFFGVNSAISGVGYNIFKALAALENDVDIITMLGDDFVGNMAVQSLKSINNNTAYVTQNLKETPSSLVLYDENGKRKIYCDLKDIQDKTYDFNCVNNLNEYNMVVACNANYNRPLLEKAKEVKVEIATDVHVLSDIDDDYNRDFMECADILFLSDEAIKEPPQKVIERLEKRYNTKIIVMGQGGNGALMYVKEENKFYDFPAIKVGKIVNTVGAGDALFSCFVSCYSNGKSAEESLQYAQLFASAKIGYDGAANGFISPAELGELYNKHILAL